MPHKRLLTFIVCVNNVRGAIGWVNALETPSLIYRAGNKIDPN